MSFTEGEPTFEDLLTLIAKRSQDTNAGSIPGRVISYDPARQIADIQPLVMVPIADTMQLVPVIREVQVRWLSGATWALVGPLTTGDVGWLRPAGADISAWKASGAENSPSVTKRKNSLSDSIFEPGTRSLSNPLASTFYSATSPVFAGNPVLLGDSTATSFVALATLVADELDAIKDYIDAHVHGGVTTGSGSTGTPASPMPAPGSVAATKVKAK